VLPSDIIDAVFCFTFALEKALDISFVYVLYFLFVVINSFFLLTSQLKCYQFFIPLILTIYTRRIRSMF